MKVYRVDYATGDPSVTFATKGAALKDAKRSAREDRNDVDCAQTVTVYEETLVPVTKAVVVRLINMGGGYVDEDRVVATFTRPARF